MAAAPVHHLNPDDSLPRKSHKIGLFGAQSTNQSDKFIARLVQFVVSFT